MVFKEMNEAKPGNQQAKKKWIGVHFMCCQVYNRIYINKEQTAYQGQCPKCLKRVSVRIGTEGTNTRFFKAW